jgi:hypothetical protein
MRHIVTDVEGVGQTFSKYISRPEVTVRRGRAADDIQDCGKVRRR